MPSICPLYYEEKQKILEAVRPVTARYELLSVILSNEVEISTNQE